MLELAAPFGAVAGRQLQLTVERGARLGDESDRVPAGDVGLDGDAPGAFVTADLGRPPSPLDPRNIAERDDVPVPCLERERADGIEVVRAGHRLPDDEREPALPFEDGPDFVSD